jgi:hypothetical protein
VPALVVRARPNPCGRATTRATPVGVIREETDTEAAGVGCDAEGVERLIFQAEAEKRGYQWSQ